MTRNRNDYTHKGFDVNQNESLVPLRKSEYSSKNKLLIVREFSKKVYFCGKQVFIVDSFHKLPDDVFRQLTTFLILKVPQATHTLSPIEAIEIVKYVMIVSCCS